MSRPIAFNRKDDEAVFLACQQAIQRSEALLLRTSDAALRTPPGTAANHIDGDILRVFYTSRIPGSKDLQQRQDDIGGILQVSRKENPSRDITGILVANKNMYSQIIEGPSSAIKDLIGRISCDARHEHVEVVSRDISRRRLFSDWSMGFVLTTLELDVRDNGPTPEGHQETSAMLAFCSSFNIRTI